MDHSSTTAIIAIIIAAGSEIIGLNSKWKANSWTQLIVKGLLTVFPKR